MMNKTLQYKEIKFPLYGGNLVIINSDCPEKVKEIIPSYDRSIVYAHSFYFDHTGQEGYGLILNFNNKNKKISHGTIAHEALHICNFLADCRGFVADFNNDEPMAYLIAWIVNQVYEFMKENKLKTI